MNTLAENMKSFFFLAFVVVISGCTTTTVKQKGNLELLNSIQQADSQSSGFAKEIEKRASQPSGLNQNEFLLLLHVLKKTDLSVSTYKSLMNALTSFTLQNPDVSDTSGATFLTLVEESFLSEVALHALEGYLAVSKHTPEQRTALLHNSFQQAKHAAVRYRILEQFDLDFTEAGESGKDFAEYLIERLENNQEVSASCAWRICTLLGNHRIGGERAEQMMYSISNTDVTLLPYTPDAYQNQNRTFGSTQASHVKIAAREAARNLRLQRQPGVRTQSNPAEDPENDSSREMPLVEDDIYQPDYLHSLAIIPIETKFESEDIPPGIDHFIAHEVMSRLSDGKKVNLVDRMFLKETLGEVNLGVILEGDRPDRIARIGKVAAAEFYLYVQLTRMELLSSKGNKIAIKNIKSNTNEVILQAELLFKLVETSSAEVLFSQNFSAKQTLETSSQGLKVGVFEMESDGVVNVPFREVIKEIVEQGERNVYKALKEWDAAFPPPVQPRVIELLPKRRIAVSRLEQNFRFKRGMTAAVYSLPIYIRINDKIVGVERGPFICNVKLVRLEEQYAVFQVEENHPMPPINAIVYQGRDE